MQSNPQSPASSPQPLEWCERRLLARIHRLTLDGLRRRIQPVEPEIYWQFVLAHHRLLGPARWQGEAGLREAIGQLQGFELPAGVWEKKILAPRVEDYDPQALDHLFLSGELVWGRLRPPKRDENDSPGMAGMTRVVPIALTLREDLPWLLPAERPEMSAFASPSSRAVLNLLAGRGALFYQELKNQLGLLPTQLEDALRELAALGLVSSDTFAAIRAIDGGASKLPAAYRRYARGSNKVHRASTPVGRWSLFPGDLEPPEREAQLDRWCRQLLARYGVVFRDVLAREPAAPPWWELVRVLRRLELRGEVRGGRFIAGVAGEQFAAESAVGKLRDLRDQPFRGQWVLLSAADPLNLAGVIGGGAKVPAMHKNCLIVQDGRAVAAKIGGRIEFFAPVDSREQVFMRKSLQVGRRVHPAPEPAVSPEPPAVIPEPHFIAPRNRPPREPDHTQLHSRRRFGY